MLACWSDLLARPAGLVWSWSLSPDHCWSAGLASGLVCWSGLRPDLIWSGLVC